MAEGEILQIAEGLETSHTKQKEVPIQVSTSKQKLLIKRLLDKLLAAKVHEKPPSHLSSFFRTDPSHSVQANSDLISSMSSLNSNPLKSLIKTPNHLEVITFELPCDLHQSGWGLFVIIVISSAEFTSCTLRRQGLRLCYVILTSIRNSQCSTCSIIGHLQCVFPFDHIQKR